MQRLFPRLRATPTPLARQIQAPAPFLTHHRFASSSPPEASEASAQSGGSRSKDAKETAERETGSGPISGSVPDALAEGSVRGRTGGGEPLKTSKNAPPKPKIYNASVPGEGENLTEEQRKEVEEHNRDFDKRHGRASKASDDKVDKKFWSESP